MQILKVFEIRAGRVEAGAAVQRFAVEGVEIPAIKVGDEFMGRWLGLGVVPVQLLPEDHERWRERIERASDGRWRPKVRLFAAAIGETKQGAPKLIQALPEEAALDAYIGVFRTPIDGGPGGVVWGNRHTGDFLGWECKSCGVRIVRIAEDVRVCPQCGGSVRPTFAEWPGDDLVVGGTGSGEQRISIIPAGVVARTGYAGRQHGGAWSHYYLYRDGRLLAATRQERLATDIF